ncbi:MAG: hypothetical protein QOI27_2696, partial [Gaiellaceae bacterium]|nr:hypothetical protein [Gaiellaceae bacterium]
PSAAAPKIVRLLSWPVLPNGAVAIKWAVKGSNLRPWD